MGWSKRNEQGRVEVLTERGHTQIEVEVDRGVLENTRIEMTSFLNSNLSTEKIDYRK